MWLSVLCEYFDSLGTGHASRHTAPLIAHVDYRSSSRIVRYRSGWNWNEAENRMRIRMAHGHNITRGRGARICAVVVEPVVDMYTAKKKQKTRCYVPRKRRCPKCSVSRMPSAGPVARIQFHAPCRSDLNGWRTRNRAYKHTRRPPHRGVEKL